MNFALNFSRPAAALLQAGQIEVDWFKCPAWPDLLAEAQRLRPTYAHFPLRVGRGTGDAVDTSTGQTPDWDAIERMMAETGTPFLNVHLAPLASDHPGVAHGRTDAATTEQVTAWLLRDVAALAQRFGAERVMVENIFDDEEQPFRAALLPETICRVVEATGCGLLLDLSHTQLAAQTLAIEPRAYIAALPVAHCREVHVTGIQPFDDRWVAHLRAANIAENTIALLAGRAMDHLPMTDDDWTFVGWAMQQLRNGAWGQPWAVAVEYGGVGPRWEALTDTQVLAEQVPRLRQLCRAG